MTNETETPAVFNAKKFIEGGYKITKRDFRSLRCIDDRDERQPDTADALPLYAVPGVAFGITLDAIAAVHALAAEHNTKPPEADKIFVAVEEILDGTLSYHTDSIHDESLACGGCGYCKASLKNPRENLFPQEVVDFVTSELLPRCTENLKQKGIRIPRYEGPHVAQAVIIVRGDLIGMPSTSPEGVHAYVYHVDVRDQLLRKSADAVYSLMAKIISADKLSPEEWQEKVISVANLRLEKVLVTLAAGLPQFEVTEQNSEIVIKAL